MSTQAKHYDMGRATYDLATGKKGYIYTDFTVDGDVPLTVEHVYDENGFHDTPYGYHWNLNLCQKIETIEDGNSITYTDGYGKGRVFKKKYYYVVKGEKIYVTLGDCVQESDGTAESPHYKRDGYGNYAIKGTKTGNAEYTVYERFEDGFGTEVKRDQEILDALKTLGDLDQCLDEKAVYYFAEGLRKLEKNKDGLYEIELYKYFYDNSIQRDNIRSDSVIFGQFGDLPNRDIGSGLLKSFSPTKFEPSEKSYLLQETALDERNTEKSKYKNVFFVRYPKTDMVNQIVRSNFDESFLRAFQTWLQTVEQYNTLFEQKIYYEEAVKTFETKLSNEKTYYNAGKKKYQKAINEYESNLRDTSKSAPTEEATDAYYENKQLLKALYKPLYDLNNTYLQAKEKQKEVEDGLENMAERKSDAERALKDYMVCIDGSL